MVQTRQAATIEFLTRLANDGSPSDRVDEVEKIEELPFPVGQEISEANNLGAWKSDEDIPDSSHQRSAHRSTFGSIRKSSAFRQSSYSSIPSVQDNLVVYTYPGGPVSLFSMVPQKQLKAKNPKRMTSKPLFVNLYFEKIGITGAIDAVKRKRITESYAVLLDPEGTLIQTAITFYNPLYLDHPDLTSGKHKTVITLPSYLGTIILPSTASEMKRDINQQFRETHPGIDVSVTLSSIRSTKADICRTGILLDMDVSSLAISIVYFEKLILRGFVHRLNMQLVAAVCLLLAAKVNETKDFDCKRLITTVSKEMEVPIKDIYMIEFSVYAALDFSLFLPLCEVAPHISRITKEHFTQKPDLDL